MEVARALFHVVSPMRLELCLILTLWVGMPACVGELDVSSLPVKGDGGSLSADATLQTKLATDSGQSAAEAPPALKDSQPAETLAPDLSPPKPDAQPLSGVGGPCPCSGTAACISGVCRAKCNTPQGACGVSSNCPKDHACLNTTAGYHVCIPAPAAPGQPCSTTVFCPVEHVCGTDGFSPYRCLPLCSAIGAPCGTAGFCGQAPNGCAFCSSP